MSKKKSSMSLKDFHGGTIPSDLTLPSAPGVFVRSTKFSAYDRSMPRTTPNGRPDEWIRPNLSSTAHIFDDKTPFLGPSVSIGRHFEEDERKPLDGSAGPRRTVRDDSFRAPASKVELKPELTSGGRVYGSIPTFQPTISSMGGVLEGANLGLQKPPGNVIPPRPSANPWNLRKEPAVRFDEPIHTSGMAVSVESKIAHASAVDKISSGKWQTKQCTFPTDVEVTDSVNHENIGSLLYDEHKKERIASKPVGDENSNARTYDSRIYSPAAQLDPSERPKLKLLPRTKPLENSETIDANTDERRRLNLKPRTQAMEQSDGNPDRGVLFGGARPRELVLKDRGVDETVLNNQDMIQPSERVPKLEKLDTDGRRTNWRKNNKEIEKNPPPQRAPSPESWRKPVEPEKPAPANFGKTASALELTQAFARSLSDTKTTAGSYKTQPFSRLMDTTKQINGY